MPRLAFALLALAAGSTALAAGCAAPTTALSRGPADTPKLSILLWFDTEDLLLLADDDATLRLAEFLTREGVRTTFKIVGEKARLLEQRGRHDVIAALKKHEIGYHSDFHSVHPTPAQYLSTLGWDEGVLEFLRREGAGVEALKRIFGQSPSCYGQPGSSWGPQSFGALRTLGIPVYLDVGSHVNLDRKPMWYGGILTFFNLEYTLRTGLGGPDDLEKAKKNFTAAREKLLKDGGGVAHIFYHPCEWVHKQFWDGVNFADGANPPREEWKLPAQKSAEETRVAFETFENYIRWIKTFPDVEFLTARDALRRYADQAHGRVYDAEALVRIAAAVGDEISYQDLGDSTLAPSEIFRMLLGYFLTRKAVLCTPTVWGPTTASTPLEAPFMTTWSQFTRTAEDVLRFMDVHKRIPPTVWLGSAGVPPEAFLAALARTIPGVYRKQPPPREVEIRPAKLATGKHVAENSPKIWGWLFPKGFHAPEMMQLARRQAWTIKPAVAHPEGPR